MFKKLFPGFFLALFFALISIGHGQNSLILQKMTWQEVQSYLQSNDMVIIPIGSTEQHGPHLPLGTDFFQSIEICKKISEKTGVIVAPVVLAGYSVYHSGFPGTLSLKPETFEEVLFETAEILIKYGFRRIMFFNYHGGNNVSQQNVIHRINHETEAIAVAIGLGGPVQKSEGGEFFDWHAGKSETSNMLYLHPELVRKDKMEQPKITLPEKTKKLFEIGKENSAFESVAGSLLGVPSETGKAGASHEISSNGIWSFSDVKAATAEQGKKQIEKMVQAAVDFIQIWKTVK